MVIAVASALCAPAALGAQGDLTASLLKDILPGTPADSSSPAELVVVPSFVQGDPGIVLFSADGPDGRELYSIGTSTGTAEVLDINPGPGGSNPTDITRIGPEVYFAANDGTHGVELWKTDGTTVGTQLVKDIKKTNIILVLSSPAPDFSFSPTRCENMPVQFTDQSLPNGGAGIVDWAWDFDDPVFRVVE